MPWRTRQASSNVTPCGTGVKQAYVATTSSPSILRMAVNMTLWLVHAFTTSRVDYCSSLLIGAPKKTTDKLQRVLNSAARIVSNTRTHSFPAKSATLVGRCRPSSVQSLRPGDQMSAQDGSWIPVNLLPTRLRHFWSSPPAIGWPWSSQLPTRETCFVPRTFICVRRPFKLELTSCSP